MGDNELIKPYKNRGVCVKAVGNDMQGISNIVISTFKNAGGRPAVYENSAQGLEEFRQRTLEFFEHVAAVNEENGLEKAVIPDIELWAAYLSITRQTIYTYETERNAEWRETIQMIKNAIASYKKQMALTFRTPPAVVAFDFTNNHHYLNSTEYRLTVDQAATKEQQERRAIEQEIMDSGLVWNETKGEFEPR